MNQKIVAHVNFAKGFRGGERQTQLLIEQLSLQGFQQILLVRKKSELLSRCNQFKNLKIIEISKPYIFHLKHLKGVALIHAHETKALQFSYVAHKILKIPYIVTRRVDNLLKTNWLNKKMYATASYAIALSKAIQQEILRVSPLAITKIIPSAYSNAIVNEQISQNIKQRFKDKFLIGNIGALVESHKGQSFLIEAAKNLEKEYPSFHFIFLGRGEDEERFKQQAQGLTNITFEGFVDNVNDYINCFELFVFPSRHEGLGSILFDVMQLNVPIIASNVGGIPDIITDQENGILVKPCNSQEIQESIIALYENSKKREKLAFNAKSSVHHYSPKSMTQSYIKIYKEIL